MDADGDGVATSKACCAGWTIWPAWASPPCGCSRSSLRPTTTTATTRRTTTASIPATAAWATSSSSPSRPRQRGIRVIIDLVINHTSDQHPWFKAARKDGSHAFGDYYYWSKKKPSAPTRAWSFPACRRPPGPTIRGARLLSPPFLPVPARPQPREPGGAGRDSQDHGLLAAARGPGFRVDAVPFIIETVPQADWHTGRSKPGKKQGQEARDALRLPARPARLSAVAQRRRPAAGRGQRPARRQRELLRCPKAIGCT